MPHEWDSSEYVTNWIENGDKTDPQRTEQIRLLVSLIRCDSEANIDVLDLGAGYGVVTREILTAYPNAKVVCVDGSAEMLKHAKHRLADCLERLDFIVANFDSPDWLETLRAEQRFDAVLSSRAIHHTVDDRKRALYQEIFERLKPGGCFTNHDLVRRPDEPIQDGANPFGTLEAQIGWLEDIGYVDVQCFWQMERRALFGGYKPVNQTEKKVTPCTVAKITVHSSSVR